MNSYNFSIKHREEFNISSERIWKIISQESNLNLYHPFCKNNDIVSWNNESHHDILEYLNGVIIERKFDTFFNLNSLFFRKLLSINSNIPATAKIINNNISNRFLEISRDAPKKANGIEPKR